MNKAIIKDLKSGLTIPGKIINFLRIYTFRVQKVEPWGKDKVKCTYTDGFNYYNPLTYITLPIFCVLAVLEGGLSEMSIGSFKRETWNKIYNKSKLMENNYGKS